MFGKKAEKDKKVTNESVDLMISTLLLATVAFAASFFIIQESTAAQIEMAEMMLQAKVGN